MRNVKKKLKINFLTTFGKIHKSAEKLHKMEQISINETGRDKNKKMLSATCVAATIIQIQL